MKLLIVTVLTLFALGGCAITTAPSTVYGPVGPRDRSSEDCRGVWDNLANACIGG